jgi:hypothetical protein
MNRSTSQHAPIILAPAALSILLVFIVACAGKSPTDPTKPGTTNTATNAQGTNATNTVAPYVGFPQELAGTWTNAATSGGGYWTRDTVTFSQSNFTFSSLWYSNNTVLYGTNGYLSGTYVTNSGSNWVSQLTYLNTGGSGTYTFLPAGSYTGAAYTCMVGSNYWSFPCLKLSASTMVWNYTGTWGALSVQLTNSHALTSTNFKL